MNKLAIGIFSGMLLLPGLACAQSLQEQISNVDNVMAHQTAAEAEAQVTEQKRAQEQHAAEALARAKEQGRAAAQYAAQSAERNKQLAAQQSLREQAKLREQAREDKLRDLQVEEASLDLEAKRARAKRANEFVDQELKEKAANTDVVQSEADATRNISAGVADNLKSTGKAAETKAGKWF